MANEVYILVGALIGALISAISPYIRKKNQQKNPLINPLLIGMHFQQLQHFLQLSLSLMH